MQRKARVAPHLRGPIRARRVLPQSRTQTDLVIGRPCRVTGKWRVLLAASTVLLCAAFAANGSPSGAAGWRSESTEPARATACPATQGYSIDYLRAMRRAGDLRDRIWGNICGPTIVTPGVTYTFTIVITNISDTTYRPLTLHVSHYEPVASASAPYRREAPANGDPKMTGAAWMLTRLKPGRSHRISFTLPFARHPDPKASNFDIQVFSRGSPYWDRTYDVSFVKQ